ncbi:hypothetical protein [uncultured Nostoc sp.]|uniref:hypothetical protein n=1 Tax=uncultured Nostoc sp. TaxID=340711 RepID=UPI0035CA0948
MQEIEIGLRVDPVKGLTFFGLDEVNELLVNGSEIKILEPVGALTQQIQQDDGSVHLTISGFSIKVKLLESSNKKSSQSS